MTSYTIRPAEAADAAVVSEIGRTTFCETFGHLYDPIDLNQFLVDRFTPAIQAAEIASPPEQYAYFVAEMEGKIVGYLLMGACDLPVEKCDVPEEARALPAVELKRLYIREAYQGMGLGKALMETAMEYAHSQQAAQVFLGVWEENYKAQGLYSAHGFEPVGGYRFKVGDRGHEDQEIIMRKELRHIAALKDNSGEKQL